jgi:hypothetical protein
VRAVVGGDALPSPVVTRRLIGEFAARAKKVQPSAALDALTERERDVVTLVAPGPHQRRDCRAPGYQPSDDEDVRQPSDDQGRRAGSGPTGGARPTSRAWSAQVRWTEKLRPRHAGSSACTHVHHWA